MIYYLHEIKVCIITVCCKYVLGCNVLNSLILYLACAMQAKMKTKVIKNVYDLWNVHNKVCIDMISKLGSK